jgi:PAS domain S-box-containing protein
MLEGLSLAHPLIVAIDSSRCMVWMSNEMGLVYPGAATRMGQPIEVLLDEVAVTMSADDKLDFLARANDLVDELNASGRALPVRFDVGIHPAVAVVEVSAFRFETDDGESLGVCMARRLAPEAPIAPELAPVDPNSRLAFILDATPDAVLAVDRLGFVTSANAAAGRILGHPHRELLDRPLLQFVRKSKSATRIAEAMAARGAVECEEIEITRADGQRAWLSISARRHALARTDSTTSTETIVVIRDVTARHLASEALVRKNEELENCIRNVSHDLRSPIASLLGFTRLLRDDYEEVLASTGNQFLDRIEAAGRNMESLLQGMLELSRIGARPPERTRVNPQSTLMQLRSELKLRLDEKRIRLSIPENPPTVLADATQLYQLFSNLIGNAVSHRDPILRQDALGQIDVEIDEVEDGWLISVSDDGPGIALEDQDRVFEMFQTAGGGGHGGGKKSSGLGLAIVKEIVESHRGRIWIESAPRKSTRVVVHLPDAEPETTTFIEDGSRLVSPA